jgi:hypothetical protein
MREHWRELKKIGNLLPGPSAVAPTALDAASVEQADPAGVRMAWADAYAKLAQHHREDPRYDVPHHDRITADEHIEDEDGPTEEQRAAGDELNAPLTRAEVEASVKRLQRGKAVGSDGITVELLKEGGPAMIDCLYALCCLVWRASEVPLDWLRGVVVPLHKSGDRRDPLNYRPITLLSIVGKVYSSVLCTRLTPWAERHGVLVPEQGGFRPGRGCAEHLFALTELISMRRTAKLTTYACFIDIKKAYDTVWHAGLMAKLQRCGIHGSMYRALGSLYAGCESTIRLGAQLGFTDFFPIETGVRQGCILSPPDPPRPQELYNTTWCMLFSGGRVYFRGGGKRFSVFCVS